MPHLPLSRFQRKGALGLMIQPEVLGAEAQVGAGLIIWGVPRALPTQWLMLLVEPLARVGAQARMGLPIVF